MSALEPEIAVVVATHATLSPGVAGSTRHVQFDRDAMVRCLVELCSKNSESHELPRIRRQVVQCLDRATTGARDRKLGLQELQETMVVMGMRPVSAEAWAHIDQAVSQRLSLMEIRRQHLASSQLPRVGARSRAYRRIPRASGDVGGVAVAADSLRNQSSGAPQATTGNVS